MKLFKTLFLSLILALITSQLSAQIKVWNNNNVSIGYNGQVSPLKLVITGSSYQHPKDTKSGGFWFQNYRNNIGSPNSSFFYNEPIMEPQFSNAMWIGRWTRQMWRGYFFEVSSTSYKTVSDENLKKNIVQWQESALAKISNINAYKYDYDISKFENIHEDKKEAVEESGRDKIGFLASNIQAEFPQLVSEIEDTDYLSVDYVSLIPVLLEAIKEQQLLIEELQTKVTALENE